MQTRSRPGLSDAAGGDNGARAAGDVQAPSHSTDAANHDAEAPASSTPPRRAERGSVSSQPRRGGGAAQHVVVPNSTATAAASAPETSPSATTATRASDAAAGDGGADSTDGGSEADERRSDTPSTRARRHSRRRNQLNASNSSLGRRDLNRSGNSGGSRRRDGSTGPSPGRRPPSVRSHSSGGGGSGRRSAPRALTSRQTGTSSERNTSHSGGGGKVPVANSSGWSSEAMQVARRPVLAWRDATRVTCMAVSPGGHLFTGGDPGGGIRVWDSRTGVAEYLLEGHQAAVLALTTLPAVDILLSGGADRTARLWSLQTLQNTLVLEGHNGFVNAVACVWLPESGLTLFTGCDDGSVRHWNGGTGACLCVFREHAAPVNTIQFLRGAVSTVASGGGDGLFIVYNLVTKKCASSTRAHPVVWDINQLETDERVLTCGSDDVIRVWANQWNRNPVELMKLKTPGCFVRGIRCLFSYRQFLFAGGVEGEVVLWDTYDPPVLLDNLVFHSQSVTGLTLESNKLCSCAFDHGICRWDITDRLVDDQQPVVPFQPLLMDDGSANRSKLTDVKDPKNADKSFAKQQTRLNDHVTPEEAAQLYAELPLDFVVATLKTYNFDWRFWIELILFCIYFVIFMVLFTTVYPIENSFFLSSGLESSIGHYPLPSFRLARTFSSVTTPEYFYGWLSSVAQQLWIDRSAQEELQANASGAVYPMMPGGNVLISTLQVRVKRTGHHSCAWNRNVQRRESGVDRRPADGPNDDETTADSEAPNCYKSWTSAADGQPESREPFVCPLNRTAVCRGRATPEGAKLFSSHMSLLNISRTGGFTYSERVGAPVAGALLSYGSGGFATEFYYSQPFDVQQQKINALQDVEFVDDVSTRLIDVGTFVYNVHVDTFFKLQFLVEAPTGDAWFGVSLAKSFEVFNLGTMRERLGLQVFLFILTVAALVLWFYDFIVGIVRSQTKMAQVIFDILQPSTLFNLLTIVLLFVSSCYFFSWIALSSRIDMAEVVGSARYTVNTPEDNIAQLRSATTTYRNELTAVGDAYSMFLHISGLSAVLLCIKAVSYISSSPYVAVFARAIHHTWFGFLALIAVVLMFGIGFSVVGHLLYGPQTTGFRTIPASFSTISSMIMGGSGFGQRSQLYESLLSQRYASTTILFLLVQMLMPLLMMTFLISILVEGYRVVAHSMVVTPFTDVLTKWVADLRHSLSGTSIRRHWPILHKRTDVCPFRPTAQSTIIRRLCKTLEFALLQATDGGINDAPVAGGVPVTERRGSRGSVVNARGTTTIGLGGGGAGGFFSAGGGGTGGAGGIGRDGGAPENGGMLRQTDLLFVAMGTLPAEEQQNEFCAEAVRDMMERVWADIAWSFHHHRQSEKNVRERDEDALLSEGISRGVRRMTEAFRLVDAVGGALEAHEMNLRPLVKSMECMS